MHDPVALSRTLRKNQTDAENLLWRHLRRNNLAGLSFRRQHPIGRYIVDFVCLEERLILEIDGGQHDIDRDKDEKRTNWFIEEGYRVSRFWNNEVLTNLAGVLQTILLKIFPDCEDL